MNVSSFIAEFLGSEHRSGATDALAAAGITGDDATKMLSAAAGAGHAHAESHAKSHGLLGDHPGHNFFSAFAAGLLKGDGFLGSLEDGGEGVLVGRVAEAIADKCGVDSDTASMAAAAATPFVVSFLKSKFGG